MVIERQGLLGSITGRWTELKTDQVLWRDGSTSSRYNGRKSKKMYDRCEDLSSIKVKDPQTIVYYRAYPQFEGDLPYLDIYVGHDINKLAIALNKRFPQMIFRYRGEEAGSADQRSSSDSRSEVHTNKKARVTENEDPKGYYNIMGIYPNLFDELDEEELQRRLKICYRNAALQHHPDHGGDEEKMKLANEAYEILSDPDKRRGYKSERHN